MLSGKLEELRDWFQSSLGQGRGYARAASNLDDTLDTISAEVETAVANSSTIDGLITDMELSSTDVSFTEETEKSGLLP